MCGIAGIFNLDGDPVSGAVVERMSAAIAHRGPDGEGVWSGRGVALGHRRLAIIDPTPAGAQPMVSADRRYVVTYNGEIYNFRELRADLQAEGHRFRTRTDTEVLLAAFAQWGPACVERFNGMFAFAVWDTVERTLFLARDRYGVKPLYYAEVGRDLVFGSEVKALLQHPKMRVRVSPPALNEYFTFQNIFTDRTLFEGVRTLPPGTSMRIPLRAARIPRPEQYWDFSFRPDPSISREEAVEETARLFEQAVQRQLVSDVEVGSYLSGGIDSGSIVAVASSAEPRLRTFTGGFDLSNVDGNELFFDERVKAERLSRLYGTDHYQVVVRPTDLEHVLDDVVHQFEDLRVGQCYPNFLVAGLASRFVKVCMSGTGADELFAGYPWRYYAASSDNASPSDYLRKYYDWWQRLVPDDQKRGLFRPWLHGPALDAHPTEEVFRDSHAERLRHARTDEDFVHFSLYFEQKTFLHGLLVMEDRMSMAHSLEVRVPYLDNDLVDFAERLPVRYNLDHLRPPVRLDENAVGPKSHRYFLQTRDGKQVLRKVLARYVPEDYTNGKKQGFSAPDRCWFRNENAAFIRTRLDPKRARIYEFFEPGYVQTQLDDHLEGRHNHRLLVWSLLCFESWLQQFDPER